MINISLYIINKYRDIEKNHSESFYLEANTVFTYINDS